MPRCGKSTSRLTGFTVPPRAGSHSSTQRGFLAASSGGVHDATQSLLTGRPQLIDQDVDIPACGQMLVDQCRPGPHPVRRQVLQDGADDRASGNGLRLCRTSFASQSLDKAETGAETEQSDRLTTAESR